MDGIPMIFNVDRRDDTGYGMSISKGLGNPYFHLTKVDPYEMRVIRLDFHQLQAMLRELEIAERKEANKRLHVGIKDD